VGALSTYIAVRFAAAHRDKAERNRRSRRIARNEIRRADEHLLDTIRGIRRPSTVAKEVAATLTEVEREATYTLPAARVQRGDLLKEVEGVRLDATVTEIREVSPDVWRIDLDRQPRRIAIDGNAPCVIWREGE
jgi:hypothetical protein